MAVSVTEPTEPTPEPVPSYAADALPGGRWGTYRPRGTVDAVRVRGTFTFTGPDGTVTEVADGWVVVEDGRVYAVEAAAFADEYEAAGEGGGTDIAVGRIAELERTVTATLATGPIAEALRLQLRAGVDALRGDADTLRAARDRAQTVADDSTASRHAREIAAVEVAIITSLLGSRRHTVAMAKLLARSLDSADTG